MVRTGIPGYDPTDQDSGGTDGGDTVDAGTVNIADALDDNDGGGSSKPERGSSTTSPTPNSRQSGGGAIDDSGGSPEPTPDTSRDRTAGESNSRQSGGGSIADDGSDRPEGRGDVRNRSARNPQRGPSGDPNSRQSGGGSLTDQGLGQADALNEQVRDEQAAQRGSSRNPQRGPSGNPNSRQSGAGTITDQGLGEADALNSQNRDLDAQRRQFRRSAAEDLGTRPSNVDVTFDESNDRFVAEQDLTDEQDRINRATGGRFEGVVDAGRSARQTAEDTLTGPAQTVGRAATLPASIFAGTAASGIEAATGRNPLEDPPDVDAEDALALGAAGVVTPEPSTSVGGALVATGAAAALGASQLSRQSEMDAPSEPQRITSEIEAPNNQQLVSSELEPGSSSLDSSELDAGSSTLVSEVDVPDDGQAAANEVGVPSVDATALQQQRSRVIEDDEPTQINPEDIEDPFEDIEQDPPSTRERIRRDDLTSPERTFPTGGSAVIGRGDAQSTVDAVEEAQQPTFEDGASETVTGSNTAGNTFGGVGPDSVNNDSVATGVQSGLANGPQSVITQTPVSLTGTAVGSTTAQAQQEQLQTANQFAEASPVETAFEGRSFQSSRRPEFRGFDFGGSESDTRNAASDEEEDIFGTGFADAEDLFTSSGLFSNR